MSPLLISLRALGTITERFINFLRCKPTHIDRDQTIAQGRCPATVRTPLFE